MSKRKHLLTTAVALLLVTNLACPVTTSPGVDPDQLEFSYELSLLKGLCLIWYRDQPVRNPNTITLGPFPTGVQFQRFPVWAGAFSINSDFRGDPEFILPIMGNGSNRAWIDSDQDRAFDSNEVSITYDSSSRTVSVNNPFGGFTVASGAYATMFYPGVFSLSGDAQNEFEVPLRMTRGSMTWDWTLLGTMNTFFFSQVASGTVGDLQVGTRFPTTNPNGNSVSLFFDFFSNSGSPLNVTFDGQTGTSFSRSLGMKASHTFDMPPEGSFRQGYGKLRATGNVQGSATFATFQTPLTRGPLDAGLPQQTGQLVGEAGITASRVSTAHVLEVRKTANDDTAFAVVNPTSKELTLKLTLKNRSNEIVAQKTITLAGKNKIQQFFLEAVDMQGTSSFEGTLLISANGSIAVMILNTFKGVQSSSIEAASANNR